MLLGKRSGLSVSEYIYFLDNLHSNQVHAVYPKITQEALVKMSANEIINYDASRLS